MKLLYRTEYRPEGYPGYTYIETDTDFCCLEMGKAWNKIIRFGLSDSYGHKISNYVNIKDNSQFPNSYPIKFCPFCGEVIETIAMKKQEFTKEIIERKVKCEEWRER